MICDALMCSGSTARTPVATIAALRPKLRRVRLHVAPIPEQAEDEGRQAQQHDGVRHRLGKRMEREEVERAQLHAAGTERRVDEVARLEDRVDLVLPGIELPEPRQPEQEAHREDEEQHVPFIYADVR